MRPPNNNTSVLYWAGMTLDADCKCRLGHGCPQILGNLVMLNENKYNYGNVFFTFVSGAFSFVVWAWPSKDCRKWSPR